MSLVEIVINWNKSHPIVTPEGTVLRGGYKTCLPLEHRPIKNCGVQKEWFTNFNQGLLDKVLDHKRNNDQDYLIQK